jgi:predicted hotdog family 3-hydroxylacyl-ACP dehydratase
MKTKAHFAFRIDVWDSAGDNLVEHLAGLDDYAMAVAAYWAAVKNRPKDKPCVGVGFLLALRALPLHTPSREGLWPRLLDRLPFSR